MNLLGPNPAYRSPVGGERMDTPLRDPDLTLARNAITQEIVALRPNAPAREALAALARTGASHLLVSRRDDHAPEGVISELDLLALVAH